MRTTLLARSAVMGIEAYRRYLSPYKGYACAYHAATGRSSCSRYAQHAIGRRGVWAGVVLLRRRFARCALAAAAFAERPEKLKDDKFFGPCDPAVQEFRKLYCSGCLEGLGD